ncbi:MAG TPA: AAA family ATPase [Candidatus Adamsella sp.]|nr:AAA family ATPase [Candidatus Adamsella sp.]
MTLTLAIIGKSGSGKTTVTKAFMRVMKEKYPEKSILLFDNDLTCELGHTFGLDIRNTVYGIRSGKHEYKTGIPSKMTKQEYIEWALEDIVVNLEKNVDILVSWLIGSKDCRCPITQQINDALAKFFKQYDIVIFDCELDLKYLNQLVDCHIDTALIIAEPTEESARLAARIEEYSAKYATGGQIGVVLNKIQGNTDETVSKMIKDNHIDILGVIPYDKDINGITKESETVQNAIKNMLFRLNIAID